MVNKNSSTDELNFMKHWQFENIREKHENHDIRRKTSNTNKIIIDNQTLETVAQFNYL